MKFRKKKYLQFFLLCSILFLVCLPVLNGCSSNKPKEAADSPVHTSNPGDTPSIPVTPTPEPTPAPQAKNPDPVTLHLLTWSIGARQALLDKFMEMYPWITIEVNSNINGGIIKNVIAGDKADLVFLDAGLSEWMSGDLLEELTPYIAKDETFQKAPGVAETLKAFQTGGKQWAVPFSNSPIYVYVNKDMLAKYGMEMPRNDWTYDEFLEMARKATNPAANDWGVFGMVDSMANYLTIANGSAESLRYMNANNTQSLAHTPQVIADLKWVQELTTKWHVRPSNAEMEKLGLKSFQQGNFLFTDGSYRVAEANKDATFDWDVMPYPKGKVKQVTSHAAGPVSIPKASKYKEEAFMFISFLYSIEAQKIMLDTGAGPLVAYPVLESYYKNLELWKGKNLDGIIVTEQMCCFSRDTAVIDLGSYSGGIQGAISKMIVEGGNFDTIIPEVEAYNKAAEETRKVLGW